MNPIREFYLEAIRIVRDVNAVHSKFKMWNNPEADTSAFCEELQEAFGNSVHEMRAAALQSTTDADLRRRIDDVQNALGTCYHFAFVGGGNNDWARASCAIGAALDALGPFIGSEETPKLATIKFIAELVGIERKSMTPYTKEWGDPEIPGSGSTPSLYDYKRLLPKLKEQFLHVDFPP